MTWIAWIADLMLAAAAIYVTAQALYGCILEHQAAGMQDSEEKTSKINDAKTRYALASLADPRVLLLILVGTLGKVAVGIYHVPL